jgi:hypothetical protein
MRRAAATIAVATSTLVVLGSSLLLTGCGDKAKYKPAPAYSGPKASLPKVPSIPSPATFKEGNAWTIYGIQHQLNSGRHRAEVEGKADTTITGYVVDVYKPTEPKDKEGCIFPTKKHPPTSKQPYPPGVTCDEKGGPLSKVEPPHFWIADKADEKNRAKMVIVMGYVSSYIQQEMARECYKTKKCKLEGKEDELYMDNNYSSYITVLGEPKIGSKITVTGYFGTRYAEGQQPTGPLVTPFGVIDVSSHKKGKIACDNCIVPQDWALNKI